MDDRVGLERAARSNSERFTFRDDGFAISPGPFFDAQEVEVIAEHARRVLNGQYETGVAPRTNSGGPELDKHPSYIEASMAHDADDVLAQAIRKPPIAEWAAKVSGAKRVKIWGASIMLKYPGGEAKTIVGWHQDQFYLDRIISGPSINIWIALSDVYSDSGPVRFIPRSHLWGRKYETRFFDSDVEKQKRQIDVPEGETWEEIEAVLPAGWASAHHAETLHGSSANYSGKPRLNLLINAGIDDFTVLPGSYFATRVDDDRAAPVIYSVPA